MRYVIDVPQYDPERGVITEWDEDAEVSVSIRDGKVFINANPAGLRSIARHCLVLSQEGMPDGRHIHLDDWNGLSEGSVSMTIERS